MTDPVLAVYGALTCPTGGVPIACNDETCASLAEVLFAASLGTTYLIRVGDWNGQGPGTFYLTITRIADGCDAPIDVGLGVNPAGPAGQSGSTYSNVGAAGSAFSSEAACAGGGSLTGDVFFSFTAPYEGDLVVSTCTPSGFAAGSLSDTVLAVYDPSACPAGGTALACNDESCSSRSELTVQVVAGNSYLIRVGGWDGLEGTFYLSLQYPAPSNDEPAGAITLAAGINPSPPAGSPSSAFTNVAATQSPPMGTSSTSPSDVWFSYTPAETGMANISLCTVPGFPDQEAVDRNLRVFLGSTEIAYDDDSCFLAPAVEVLLTAGTTYLVSVGAVGEGSVGPFRIKVTTPFGLTLHQPNGPGSLGIRNHDGPPSGFHFTALTFTAGAFPNGWFFGLDPAFAEIALQTNAGPPFVGLLDATGGSNFVVNGLPPLGIALYGVTVAFGSGGSFAISAPTAVGL
jgi:hypothetical protein